jgi:predicted GNAT family acetyltransferase
LGEKGELGETTVRDNAESTRYELWAGDTMISFADYTRSGDVLTVPHVETRPDLRGHGNADRLMKGMLDDLRSRGLRIRPTCPHALEYLRDHPEQSDLLA